MSDGGSDFAAEGRQCDVQGFDHCSKTGGRHRISKNGFFVYFGSVFILSLNTPESRQNRIPIWRAVKTGHVDFDLKIRFIGAAFIIGVDIRSFEQKRKIFLEHAVKAVSKGFRPPVEFVKSHPILTINRYHLVTIQVAGQCHRAHQNGQTLSIH